MDNKNIGILDPDGVHNNPITKQPYTENYKTLAKSWSKLPAYQNARDNIEQIRLNNVLLVVSGTGSGKTVLFPKYVLHTLNYEGRVAITMPKQIITKSSAEYAAATLDVELKKDVGYQYKNSGKTYSKDSKLIYCTDGTLVSMILKDPLLIEFDAVLIDEAHERKVNIDFLLYLLKNVLSKRPKFKLIIMSATINEELFRNYYKDFRYHHIHYSGKTNYEIESKWLSRDLDIKKNQYLEMGLDMIKDVNDDPNNESSNGILFFVPSIKETFDTCNTLETDYPVFVQNKDICVPVYSGMDKEQERLAKDKDYYREITDTGRKIIIATNVAESSITINGIHDVIDSGLEIKSGFEPLTRIFTLNKDYITHAQAKQRMGRTGRTGKGVCHHLYTKERFEKLMDRFPEPAIRSESISYEMLRLLSMPNINMVGELRKVLNGFIEPPKVNSVVSELMYLEKVGLIDKVDDDGKLTALGEQVVKLQMEPQQAKTLLMGFRLFCFREVIAILTVVDITKANLSKLFTIPKSMDKTSKLAKRYKNARSQWNNNYGDHMAILKIFKKYEEMREKKKERKWCYDNFLSESTLRKIYDYYVRNRSKYFSRLKNMGLEKVERKVLNEKLANRIMTSFIYGYRINKLKMKNNKLTSKNVHLKNIKIDIDRDSFLTKVDDAILYDQLFRHGKNPVKAVIVSTIPKKCIDILSTLGL